MTDEQKRGTAFDAIDGSCTCERLWASTNRQINNYSIFKKEEETMTEKSGNDVGVTKTETADTGTWSELTFTCPRCGSHKLLECLGGRVVYGLVDEIHYKPEEVESEEDNVEDTEEELEEQDATIYDDVEDAYVLVQSRSDGTEIWDFGVDNASDHYSWFRCAECDYELAFEDGSPVEDAMELAQWLIRYGK
jgi:hypothetical protein